MEKLYLTLWVLLVVYTVGSFLLLILSEWRAIIGPVLMLVSIVAGVHFINKEVKYQAGTPIPFSILSENYGDQEYIKIQNIDKHLLLIQTSKKEMKIVQDAPEAISSLKDGSSFKLEDILSLTSNGRFIAPMTNP